MSAQKELIVSRDIGQFPLVCAIKLRQTSVVPQVTLRRTALISSVIRILVWDTVKYTIWNAVSALQKVWKPTYILNIRCLKD